MENDDRILFRFEYYEPEDQETYIDWVWLNPTELNSYKSEYNTIKVRPATDDETDLYDEAYADGYGVAAMLEFQSQYDGVTFRVEINKDGDLDFEGKKMFECAICEKHKDFEEEVGVAGGLYLGEVKDDKLWHVCYDCAENAAMMSAIQDGMEE